MTLRDTLATVATLMVAAMLTTSSPVPAAPSAGATPTTGPARPRIVPVATPRPRATPAAAAAPSPGIAPSPLPGESPRPYTPTVQDLPVPAPVTLPAPDFVPSDVPTAPLSLQETVRIALVHQANVTVALAGVQSAQGRTQQVRAGALPTVSISATGSSVLSTTLPGGLAGSSVTSTSGASAGVNLTNNAAVSTSGATVGGSGVTTAANTASLGGVSSGVSGGGVGSSNNSNGYVVTAGLRQLIFDFNHTRDLIRQSLAIERSTFANLSRVQQDLVLQVKQGFFQYVQSINLVGVQEANLRNQQEHLNLAQARYRAGLGLPSDVVRAQTAVASAIFNLNQAQNIASIARVNLTLLMGLDPRTPIDVQMTGQSESPIDTSDPNALFRLALEQRPEVLQAIANLQASQYAISAAKTSNAPTLAATANYFTRGEKVTTFDTNSFTVGMQLSWSLYDGGLTAGRIREARANELSNQAQLIAARQNVMSDVAQAYLNLKTAEQRLITSASEVQNADETVRLVTGRYRAGLGTFLDVLDAEQALVTAQTNQVNAQSAVDQARSSLARALGMPLPDVAQAGTAVPPQPPRKAPVPPTEMRGASPIPGHPGTPSNAPGAPAAHGSRQAPAVTPPPVVPAPAPDSAAPTPAPGSTAPLPTPSPK